MQLVAQLERQQAAGERGEEGGARDEYGQGLNVNIALNESTLWGTA
jgi:hypothetical protein